MDGLFRLHADGVFLRREAIEHGYDDRDLLRARRAGLIARVRHGAYTAAEAWNGADPERQHLLRAHAVLRSHATPLAMSHTSAAIEHGLRLFRPSLARAHVTTLESRLARTTSDIAYHEGRCTPEDLVTRDGLVSTAVPRTALDAASLVGAQGGVVILDSVLDLGLASGEELLARSHAYANWPGARSLQIALRLMRPGANSVGESLARYLMWHEHLPEPQLQYEVRDAHGDLAGRTDFAWPEYGVLGEFDGKQKYGRLLRPGETAADAVVREKIREDRLRELTGFLMVRLVWSDLFAPERTAERLREQLRRGRRIRRSA